ncbi:MAG: PDDEXK nuclease domain-containing protein [Saprospiraceae bacterium]|nr:PDDEXK nuclease domain-containing protein [Saprospiraceae bacterium]
MNQTLESLYQNIKGLLLEARRRVYYKVNFIMVESYWEVGRMIVEEEQGGKDHAVYGKQILKFLSERLTAELGEGFDPSNLRYMRRFYLAFPICDALRHELSWTHYRVISKVESERARQFYVNEAIECQWGTRQLERQIYSFYYERLLSSQDKQALMTDTNVANKTPFRPEDVIKDPYILEFLNLKGQTKFSEKDLETALIDKLQAFLLELGKGFAFVARQKRIPTENKNFYIDLVFYNILLKCYVLIDLKVSELTHADIGQMDMYVRYYEDKIRADDDNPTIGIILCSEKDEAVVKYSVLDDNKQLFASKYKLYLPSEEELAQELKREVNEIRLQMRLNQADDENSSQQ